LPAIEKACSLLSIINENGAFFNAPGEYLLNCFPIPALPAIVAAKKPYFLTSWPICLLPWGSLPPSAGGAMVE
jgi:hypothetical protein